MNHVIKMFMHNCRKPGHHIVGCSEREEIWLNRLLTETKAEKGNSICVLSVDSQDIVLQSVQHKKKTCLLEMILIGISATEKTGIEERRKTHACLVYICRQPCHSIADKTKLAN